MLFRRLIPTALLLGCAACSSPEVTQAPVPAAEQRRGCVDRFDPAEDLFPEKADIRWAKGFNVTYHGYYKVLEIHGPTPTRLALVRCGAPPPELDIPTVEIPVRSVATTSTTELPHLDALGLVDRWVAHAGLGFVSSDRLRRVIDGGGVAEVGGADGGGLDVERLLEAAPDLLLVDTPERASSDPLRVLAGVGTAVVPIPSYLEQSPLGRTEWLLATALFFDREAEANRLFTDIETAYLDLRLKVEQSDAPRPTVLTGGPWQGVWHVPAGESFMARLLADAGGDFLWADEPGVGPLQLDIEAVYARARDADFWLYPDRKSVV